MKKNPIVFADVVLIEKITYESLTGGLYEIIVLNAVKVFSFFGIYK